MKVNIYMASDLNDFKPRNGHVGYVIEDVKTKRTITQFGTVENATKNKGELLGLKNALTRIKTESEVTLYIDNFYIKNAYEQGWLVAWVKSGWKTAKGKEVAEKEEWQAVTKLLAGRIPEIITNAPHEYRTWLETELKRRNNNV